MAALIHDYVARQKTIGVFGEDVDRYMVVKLAAAS